MAAIPGPTGTKEPVYECIKHHLRAQIDRGELAEGARVPSEHQLARQLSVSRNQTRQALRELELEGYVTRRQGSGTFVAPRKDELATISMIATGAAVMIFPQYLSDYCRNVVNGFMWHMAKAERQTITYNWQQEQAAELRLLRAIGDSQAAGLVVWLEHDNEETRSVIRELREQRFPVVLVDRYLHDVDIDVVQSDHVAIGYRLTRALIERGHTRIAYAGWLENGPSSIGDRVIGYRRALEEAGLSCDEGMVGGSTRELEEDALTVVRQYMALPARPTAFVCLHDRTAHFLHDSLVSLGYRVPKDVMLAASGDGHHPERPDAPMLVVRQQAQQIGQRSAAALLARMQAPDAPPELCFVEPTEVLETEPEQARTAAATP